MRVSSAYSTRWGSLVSALRSVRVITGHAASMKGMVLSRSVSAKTIITMARMLSYWDEFCKVWRESKGFSDEDLEFFNRIIYVGELSFGCGEDDSDNLRRC